jgi:4-methoxybenzoate monooxygenase (O-demethylating)
MFLGVANRDPRRSERPDEYDISRRMIGHAEFGTGIHQCVGSLVARLEGKCTLIPSIGGMQDIKESLCPWS